MTLLIHPTETLLNLPTSSPEQIAEETIVRAEQLGMDVQRDAATGRVQLQWHVGDQQIDTASIPTHQLTNKEVEKIIEARYSYAFAWAYNGAGRRLRGDYFDSFPENPSPYNDTVTHQLTTLAQPAHDTITITHRSVGGLSPEHPIDTPWQDDASFWLIRDCETKRLIDGFQNYLGDFITHNKIASDPREAVLAITRTAKHPYPGTSEPLERDKSALGFAQNQLAVLIENTRPIWVCMLRHEFPEKVLGIRSRQDKLISPNLPHSENTLGMPNNWEVKLDRRIPDVVTHILHYPGYWQNSDDATRLLLELASDGKLTDNEIRPRYEECVDNHPGAGFMLQNPNPSLETMIRYLTRPAFAKYLVPLYTAEGKINRKLSGDELRNRVLTNVDDGAYSSTILPDMWRESVFRVINAFQQKWG